MPFKMLQKISNNRILFGWWVILTMYVIYGDALCPSVKSN